MTDEGGDLGPPRWLLLTLAIAAVLVVAATGVFMVIYTSQTATFSRQARDLIVAQQQAQKRADCRTTYNADRQSVIDRATALEGQADAIERQSNIGFAGFLLGDPGSGQALLVKNKADLEAANKLAGQARQTVLDFPKLDDMMRKGYTSLDGAAHPPCPQVH